MNPIALFGALAQHTVIKTSTIDGESSMTLTELVDKKSVRHCKDIGYAA